MEDLVAQDMARLVYEKVVVIAETQKNHTTRLARLETTTDEIAATQKIHTQRLSCLETKVEDLQSQFNGFANTQKRHSQVLDKHGEMLEKHSELLEKQGEMLERHSEMLERILAKLDAR